MAFVIIHHFPGGTREQYDAVIAAAHPNGGKDLPPGQVYHAAGPVEGGWRITAVHDSRASWEAFKSTLMAKMGAGIPGSFAAPPQETEFEAHNFQVGSMQRA